MDKEISQKLTDIFRDVFDDESISLSRQTTARDIEDWDSLAQISLLVAIEKEYDIKFLLAEIDGLSNVGDMMDLIDKKTRQ